MYNKVLKHPQAPQGCEAYSNPIGCRECAFEFADYKKCKNLKCTPDLRIDHKNVIFKEKL